MEIKLESRKYVLTLVEPLLGTVPKDKEIYKTFILNKAVEKGIETNGEEEVATVEELGEKGYTGFHTTDTGLILFDYMIKGNIKANLGILIGAGTIKKITAYKTAVDNMVFVHPRQVPLIRGGLQIKEPEGVLERPLRVMTMQGPRVSLTKSDIVLPGAEIAVSVEILPNPKIDFDTIETALNYGCRNGLGQWRGSGGYGRYEWK